jgi:Na+/citrate or Na+/malate symporter
MISTIALIAGLIIGIALGIGCQVTVLLLRSPIVGKTKPVVRTLCGLVD